jgi:S1-C subfamily serine protease
MSTEDKDYKKNDDQYSFIKEQIVPKKKNNTKKVAIIVGTTVSMAILFGFVCRFVFEASEPLVGKLLGKKETENVITFPTASPVDEVEESEEDNDSSDTNDEDAKAQVEAEDEKKDEDVSTKVVEKTVAATLEDYNVMHGELKDLAEQVNRSIVTVTSVVSGVDWFNNIAESTKSTSGLIIANDGTNLIILTNKDRLNSTKNIRVTFSSDLTVTAKYRNSDNTLGIVILTVPLESVNKSTLDRINVANLGQSYSIKTGDPVLALGSPNGYAYSMDIGIVTNEIYYSYITDQKIELFNTNIHDNPNGEGVIVNLKGEIIGLITQDFKSDLNKNINTVLAISRIKKIVDKLINETEQVYFGIVGADLTAKSLESLGVNSGVYISEVKNESPAFYAGLESGDVILKLDDSTISSMDTFYNIISSHEPEDTIKVLVKRKRNGGTKQLTLRVELGVKK